MWYISGVLNFFLIIISILYFKFKKYCVYVRQSREGTGSQRKIKDKAYFAVQKEII